jgi:hypothetical protein
MHTKRTVFKYFRSTERKYCCVGPSRIRLESLNSHGSAGRPSAEAPPFGASRERGLLLRHGSHGIAMASAGLSHSI